MDWILIGLGISSALVVVFSIMQQFRQNRESLEAKTEQLKQKDEIITELKNIIIGGDSYLFLRPYFSPEKNEITFGISFRGKYPLFDVNIKYSEYDIIFPSNVKARYSKLFEIKKDLGTITPVSNDVYKFSEMPPLGQMVYGKRYFFNITSRNGYVEQEVLIRKKDQGISIAYSLVYSPPEYSNDVFMVGYGKTRKLIRHIDQDFPVDEIAHMNGGSGWGGKYENSTGKEIE